MADRIKLYAHRSGAIVEDHHGIMDLWYKINVSRHIVSHDDQRRCRPTCSKRKDLDYSADKQADRIHWNVTSKGNFAFTTGWKIRTFKREGVVEEETYFNRDLNYKHRHRLLGPIEILV